MKREGPPQLQFLIATDLSQFRDEDSKSRVRSQAMMHWRHEENKRKIQDSSNDELAPGSAANSAGCDACARSEYASAVPVRTRPVQSTQSVSAQPGQRHDQQQHEPWQIESGLTSSRSTSSFLVLPGSSRWQLTATETAGYFPHHRTQRGAITDQAVTDYEESERHEARQILALAVGIATVYGDIHDPFKVMPQFQDVRLDAMYLSRSCECRESGENGC